MKCVIASFIVFTCVLSGQAVIIDHNDIATLDATAQSVMDSVGDQRWFFTHASVGGNMISGMNSLHSLDATRYRLTTVSASATPPATTYDGRVYEYNRGNPGWSAKYQIFETCVRTNGWDADKVDIVMDKLCYIDTAADASVYTAMMAQLEADYPDLVFVYATMPIKTSVNLAARTYNAAVRAFCTGNDRILFDIADIEAHTPAGVLQTALYGGTAYPVLYSGYTTDGGHLNATGAMQVARGWYAVAAYIDQHVLNPRKPGDANGDGFVDIQDFVILKQNYGLVIEPQWEQGDFNGDGIVDIQDFVILKQNYGH